MGARNGQGPGRSRGSRAPLPRALRDGILTTDVGAEVVVYDSKQNRGHCLNPAAAVVWRHLDGRTTMDEMVACLRRELDRPADEDMVWLALKALDRVHLLEEPLDLPAARDISRRGVLRRLGVAAGTGVALLPAISSILAPPVHAQASGTGCAAPEPDCQTFSCAGGCACGRTTEGTIVCGIPACGPACASSAGCPPGFACSTLPCCGGAPFCISLVPVGFNCGGPKPPPVGGRAWKA
jgi:hypothetical protein